MAVTAKPRIVRADAPLTDEIVALIVAYMAGDTLDTAFIAAVSRVAMVIIEEEIKQQTALLSIEYTIDPIALAQEWIAQTESRIVGINDVTAARIKALLQQSIEEAETIVQAAQRIRAAFDAMNRGRAITIARTEVLGATNFASWRAYQIAHVPFKRWLATMDDRVRDSHAAANGQVRGTDEAFDINGYAMMYPGDPNGPAGEVINCRCTLVPEMNARSSIWTMDRAGAIWDRYVIRAVEFDSMMIDAVRHEFETQYLGIASILHRYI